MLTSWSCTEGRGARSPAWAAGPSGARWCSSRGAISRFEPAHGDPERGGSASSPPGADAGRTRAARPREEPRAPGRPRPDAAIDASRCGTARRRLAPAYCPRPRQRDCHVTGHRFLVKTVSTAARQTRPAHPVAWEDPLSYLSASSGRWRRRTGRVRGRLPCGLGAGRETGAIRSPGRPRRRGRGDPPALREGRTAPDHRHPLRGRAGAARVPGPAGDYLGRLFRARESSRSGELGTRGIDDVSAWRVVRSYRPANRGRLHAPLAPGRARRDAPDRRNVRPPPAYGTDPLAHHALRGSQTGALRRVRLGSVWTSRARGRRGVGATTS